MLQKAWTRGSSLSAAWRSSSSAAPAPAPPPSAPCPAEKQAVFPAPCPTEKQAEGPNWPAAPWHKRSAWRAAARKEGWGVWWRDRRSLLAAYRPQPSPDVQCSAWYALPFTCFVFALCVLAFNIQQHAPACMLFVSAALLGFCAAERPSVWPLNSGAAHSSGCPRSSPSLIRFGNLDALFLQPTQMLDTSTLLTLRMSACTQHRL